MSKLARRNFFSKAVATLTGWFGLGTAALAHEAEQQAATVGTPKLTVEVADNFTVARFGKTTRGIEIRAAGDRVAIDGYGGQAVEDLILLNTQTGTIQFRDAPNTPDFEWNRANQKLFVRSIFLEDANDKCELGLRRHSGAYPDGVRQPLTNGEVPGIIYWQPYGSNGDFDDAAGGPGRIASIEAACVDAPTGVNRPGRLIFSTTPRGTTSPVERMWVDHNGNVGIGINPPSFKLEVAGDIYCHGSYLPSDARFKKEIEPLSDSLAKLQALQPVTFEWNERINSVRDAHKLNERHIGLIAQDVEKVFPEMVTHWKLDDEITDARAVAYDRLIPVLVDAVNQLTKRVAELEAQAKTP